MNSSETRTFRATWEAWLGQLLLPVIFFSTLTLTAVKHSGLHPAAAGLGLLLLMGIMMIDFLMPMLRNWATLDSHSISGSHDGKPFRIEWKNIIAAWHTRHKGRPYLCLGTQEGTLVFPLRFLNEARLVKIVRARVPCQALEENALRKLPEYQDWVSERSQVLAAAGETRTIADHWLLLVIGWAGSAVALFAGFHLYQTGYLAAAVVLAGLVAGCLFIFINWGINEFEPETIRRSTLFSSSVMDWSEVRGIEVDPFGSVIILIGERSQMAISGPVLWCGSGKLEVALFLAEQAKVHSIPLRRTYRALLGPARTRRIAG